MLKNCILYGKKIRICFSHKSSSKNKIYVCEKFSKKMASCLNWKPRGILLDITGVLYESGQNEAIEKSVEAVERLRALNIPFRFVTNESQCTRSSLVSKLKSFGFELSELEIFPPGVAASTYVKQAKLRPYLLVHPNALPEFDGCDQSSPNCVVIGDAAEHLTYENMNRAFQVLMRSENPVLISLGKGKYYRDHGDIVMDVGGFTCALEYAASVEAVIIGKPSSEFFLKALDDMGVMPNEAVMVGDDINSDVHAAQKCGMRGVLVRTGKFRESDLKSSHMKPDLVVNNLSHFVDMLL